MIRVPFFDLIALMDGVAQGLGLAEKAGPPERSADESGAGRRRERGLGSGALSTLRRLERWAAFPDYYVFWLPNAFVQGIRELKSKTYHVLYSTSPPNSCHLLGAALSAAAGLPWVADFRDPWTQNVYRTASFSPARFKAERGCEKRLLRRASALVTVSEALAEDMRDLHGDRPGGVYCITGGFDSDYSLAGVQPGRDRFTITYAGSLYGLKRDPTPLLEAVDELIRVGFIEREKILVRFYGPYEPGLAGLKNRLTYPEVVEINGVVPREEALVRLAESSIVVTMQWSNPYDEKIYGGKIFELMGVGRPVLTLASHQGLLARLVERTGLGRVCASKEEVKSALCVWIEEFKRHGCVEFSAKAEELEVYRWKNLTARLAAVLNSVSALTT